MDDSSRIHAVGIEFYSQIVRFMSFVTAKTFLNPNISNLFFFFGRNIKSVTTFVDLEVILSHKYGCDREVWYLYL